MSGPSPGLLRNGVGSGLVGVKGGFELKREYNKDAEVHGTLNNRDHPMGNVEHGLT